MSSQSFLARLALIFGASIFLSLASTPTSAKDSESEHLVKTELYFGPVDGDDWADFLEREVTPRFPQGLTWFDVEGQWRNAQGTIKKLHSRMLIMIYPRTAATTKKIEEIRTLFENEFHQQSVLSVTEKVDASF